MFDRIFVFGAVALWLLLAWSTATTMLWLVAVPGGIAVAVLLARELRALATGDSVTRAVLTLRHAQNHPFGRIKGRVGQVIDARYLRAGKAAAHRLVQEAGLAKRGLTASELSQGIEAICLAAQDLDALFPSLTGRALRPSTLAAALEPLVPNPAEAPRGPLLPVILRQMASPPEFVLPGAVLATLRRRIGRLLFGAGHAAAHDLARSLPAEDLIGANSLLPQHDRWRHKDFPALALAAAWLRLSDEAGHSVLANRPDLLPLAAQRELAAVQATLSGAPLAARLARVINPSLRHYMADLATERQFHEYGPAPAPSFSAAQALGLPDAAFVAATPPPAERPTVPEPRVSRQPKPVCDPVDEDFGFDLSRLNEALAAFDNNTQQSPAPAVAAAPVRCPDPIAKPPIHPLSDAEIDDLLDLSGRLSLFLRCDVLPDPANTTQSRLGGLPTLPAGQDWPRVDATGQPLAFLAQIDCADLPTLHNASPLPRNGQLLFFADIGHDDRVASAVIHTNAGSGPLRTSPLPPGQVLGLSTTMPRTYPLRTVTAHPVTTYPVSQDTDLPTADPAYANLAEGLFHGEIGRIIGNEPATPQPLFCKDTALADPDCLPRLRLDLDRLGSEFPQCRAIVTEFVAALRTEAQTRRTSGRAGERDAGALIGLASDLDRLTGPADEATPVPPQLAANFVARLEAWINPQPGSHTPLPSRALPTLIEACLRCALRDLAQRALSDPALRAALPDTVRQIAMAALAQQPGAAGHLMLGATNSSEVEILRLHSDTVAGFAFGAGRAIAFRIQPEDLAARRFGRVSATLVAAPADLAFEDAAFPAIPLALGSSGARAAERRVHGPQRD